MLVSNLASVIESDTPFFLKIKLKKKHYLKKRHPNPALLGGVNTFPNKKGLVRCMTMIQGALNRYDLGQHFTYS